MMRVDRFFFHAAVDLELDDLLHPVPRIARAEILFTPRHVCSTELAQDSLRTKRELVNAHSRRVIYGIPDRSHHRWQKGFTDAVEIFGACVLQGRGVDC